MVGVFAVAAVLTFLYAMFRSVQARDDMKSWRTFGFLFVVVALAPYGYAEVMTRMHGKDMRKAVYGGMIAGGFEGKLDYYKVMAAKDETARVIAVGHEREGWGGTNKIVMTVNLKKKEGTWVPTTFKIINSDRHNKDGFTFPPYF